MQTAVESSQKSAGVMDVLEPFLIWIGLSTEVWHVLIRKAAHMTEFAILAILWSAGLRKEGNMAERFGWVLLICLLTALTDETIQLFVPGRSGELRDVWIDLTGALIGNVFFWGIDGIKRQLGA